MGQIFWLLFGIGLGAIIGLLVRLLVLAQNRSKVTTIDLSMTQRFRFKRLSDDDSTEYFVAGYDPVGSGTNKKAMDVYFEQANDPLQIGNGPPPPPAKITTRASGPPPPPPDE